MNRRQLLRAGALAAGATALGLGIDAFLVEPHHVALERRLMPLDKLPPELEGRTLLQISDIHVGPRVSSEYLIRAFTDATRLTPDFVVLTGDFVSHDTSRRDSDLARVLSHFPHGRFGTVASLGNHDYGRAWREMEVAAWVTAVARDAGLIVLRNEVRAVGGIQFAGFGDYWSPEFGSDGGTQPHGLFTPRETLAQSSSPGAAISAVETIASIRADLPTVILSHNPDAQDAPIWEGVRGWVLAGHTHGGQVKPPFLPPPVVPVRNKRYTAGTFDVGPGRRMYINRGLGHLTKVRFNCRPEITLFTLARA